MNAEEPNDDYDAQAAEAARKANIEELNAVMPQFQMNAKDEGQRWEYIQDGARMVRRDYSLPRRPVVESLRPSDAVDRLNALQQQVTELEEERDEAKHLLEQSLLELDARIEEQADYMEVVKKQQQALLVLKAWIKSSKEDAATVNYEGIAQIVNEAYEAAETLTSPSTAQEEQR